MSLKSETYQEYESNYFNKRLRYNVSCEENQLLLSPIFHALMLAGGGCLV